MRAINHKDKLINRNEKWYINVRKESHQVDARIVIRIKYLKSYPKFARNCLHLVERERKCCKERDYVVRKSKMQSI